MKLNENFNQFEQNIKLTINQKEDAKKKYNSVCEKLHNNYYENEYTGKTKFLVGSYGKHTNIRPARDIDVIFILPYGIYLNYQNSTANSPSALLQKIRTILKERFPNTEISSSEKVVVVKFSDSNHNVEVIPAFYEENRGTFIIPNSVNGGSWEREDYKSEINQLDDLNKKTKGNAKKIIRFIKKWTDTIFPNIKTYKIEKHIISFFENNLKNQENEDMSTLVRDFFEYFLENDYENKNIVQIALDRSQIKTAFNRAEKACIFEKENNLEKATEEWRKIFGIDFPTSVPIDNDSEKEIINPPKPWFGD